MIKWTFYRGDGLNVILKVAKLWVDEGVKEGYSERHENREMQRFPV